MSKFSEDLLENKHVSNKKLLDYIISLQLGKIERYNNQSKEVIDGSSEEAMANLIELLKIRQNSK